MSKYIEYTVQDTRTGRVYKIRAKDREDAVEMVADFYDLDYEYLECI